MKNKILKESSHHILKKIENKIDFINDNKDKYNIRMLYKCLVMCYSVYYYHCNYTTNSYKIANQKPDVKVYDEFKGDMIYLK